MNEEFAYKLQCLRAAVRALRDKQKQYFRTRDARTLRQCKEIEAQVDKMLLEP